MNRTAIGLALAVLLLAGPAAGDDVAALKDEAKGLIKQFAGELKGELVSALTRAGR